MTSFAYSEYKESGVSWLGAIPKYWSLHKTKFLFERMHRPVTPGDGIVTAFRDGAVKGQEESRLSLEPRGHHHFTLAGGKVNERAAGKTQQGFKHAARGMRVAIVSILINRILNALREVRLEFNGCDRNAIQEQDKVKFLLGIVQGMTHLAYHA
jgi:hypothetical protein